VVMQYITSIILQRLKIILVLENQKNKLI